MINSEKLQINVTKDNCDYYVEITAGLEGINTWLRKKNTFDYWKISNISEDAKLSFDTTQEYIENNFNNIVLSLTGENIPEGEVRAEETVSEYTSVDENGFYAELLKEYVANKYIYWAWINKKGTDKRVPLNHGECEYLYPITAEDFESLKKRFDTCEYNYQH